MPELKLSAAAEQLNVSRWTIYRLVEAGKLKAYVIDGVRGLRFRTEDLDALMVEKPSKSVEH